jgi:hypothetical protein
MSDSRFNNPQRPYPWDSVPELLQKLRTLGWVRAASHVSRESGSGEAVIDFTPAGIKALKPFADFWNNTGGLTEGEALALFNVAILSLKP